MHYYRNPIDIFEQPKDDRPLEEKITELYYHLQFGGKLNDAAREFCRILDFPPTPTLIKTVPQMVFQKEIQLQHFDLEELDELTDVGRPVSLTIPLAAAAIVAAELGKEPFYLIPAEDMRPNTMTLTAILHIIFFLNSESSPRAVYTTSIRGDYGKNAMCHTHITGVFNILESLEKKVKAEVNTLEIDYLQYLVSLGNLLHTLRDMLFAFFQPSCLDPECEIEHEYPELDFAKKELLIACIKLAIRAEIYPDFRAKLLYATLRGLS